MSRYSIQYSLQLANRLSKSPAQWLRSVRPKWLKESRFHRQSTGDAQALVLAAGQALPPEFARPEVAQILMEYYQQEAASSGVLRAA